jgi:Protein of unknown function (DUF2934)
MKAKRPKAKLQRNPAETPDVARVDGVETVETRAVSENGGNRDLAVAERAGGEPSNWSAENRLMTKEPVFEVIRLRAYELFLRREGRHGNELTDWLDAERELRCERSES